MYQGSTKASGDGLSPTSVIAEHTAGGFINRMLHHKGNAGMLRSDLYDFFNMLKANPEEMRAFSINVDHMATFMKLMHEPGVDDKNNLLMHTIFVYLSEIDAKGDREGLRNMINCTFRVKKWSKYNKMVDEMLDRGNLETFQKACRLYSLYTFVNEIRRRSLPPGFFSFVSKRAEQLVCGLKTFPDRVTLGYTLECLWTMISAFDESRKTVVKNNGGFVLLQVVQNNLEHGELVELSLKILSPLTVMLIKSHDYLYNKKDGIYEVVMECVMEHMKNDRIVEAGCSIMRRALIGRPADAKNMFKAKMRYIIGVIKSNHSGSPDIEMSVSQLEYLMRGTTIDSHDGLSSSVGTYAAHARGRSIAFWDKKGKASRTRHARSASRPPAPELYSRDYEKAIKRSNRGQ